MKDKIDLALADDIAIPIEAHASRHELVAGEKFSVEVVVAGSTSGRPQNGHSAHRASSCRTAGG